MAHYAFLDKNNVVTEVITGKECGPIDWEEYYGKFRKQVCKRTSYNTKANIHSQGGIPFRKNYAGIGYKYDVNRDAFISPQPYASWILDEQTCTWCAPVPKPNDNKMYYWEEYTKEWIEINP
jgi:hypothetical protein